MCLCVSVGLYSLDSVHSLSFAGSVCCVSDFTLVFVTAFSFYASACTIDGAGGIMFSSCLSICACAHTCVHACRRLLILCCFDRVGGRGRIACQHHLKCCDIS